MALQNGGAAEGLIVWLIISLVNALLNRTWFWGTRSAKVFLASAVNRAGSSRRTFP
jgi:hypothetical protein